MTNLNTTIEDGGYLYGVKPLERGHPLGLSYAQAMAAAHFIGAFELAQQEWEAKIKTNPDLLQYADSYYLHSMVVGCEGSPGYLIANVDDIVQSFPFDSQTKIEETT